MPASVVHAMDTAWASSGASLAVSVQPEGATDPGTSNLLSAPLGAVGRTATYTPAAPLDLSGFDELRFWLRADRAADGSQAAPYWLTFEYRDQNDAVGEEHRWFVPVNAAGVWEQRRIGIAADRRSAVNRLRFTALDDEPFAISVDELLAVEEQMLVDLEGALVGRLSGMGLPELTGVAVATTSAAGSSKIVVPAAVPFAAHNRILVTGGTAGDETHDVTGIAPGPGAGRQSLQLADQLVGTLNAGVAHVTVLVPVVVESPPNATDPVEPAVIVTPLGVVEDPERTPYVDQRDSFRLRNGRTVCSVRPSARAYLVDYQITPVGPNRRQQLVVADQIRPRISVDVPLRVNGASWPVWILPDVPLLQPGLGAVAPMYVRIGGRSETTPRIEVPWVQQLHVGAARPDRPSDSEGIVLQL